MPIRADQLPAALQRGLSPIYLIGGPETLLVQECRDQVLAAARAAGFLERDIIHADRSFDWESLGSMAGAPSLFASRRIIDLRMPTGKPGVEGANALVEWAEQPDPDTLLLVSCEEWDAGSRKSKWATVLDKAGTRVDIWPVKAAELPAWIGKRMRSAGLAPEVRAVELLAERVEGNLLAAQQEIDKLLLQKGPGPVSAEEVLAVVADSSRFDAFLLAERVLAGDHADSLRVAAGLRRTGIAVPEVVGALYYEFRQLDAFCQAMRSGQDEYSAFQTLRVWQSRQGPMRQAARRLAPARLGRAFSDLALMDRQGKGQAPGDPWHSLDQMVSRLCD